MALIGEMKYLTIGGNTYSIPEPELPIASSSTLGGIKVGSGLTIDSSTGVLTATGTSITIDTAMSDSSTNTVQNKVIKSYVDTNIPTKVSDLQNDSGFTTNTGTVTSVRVQASSPLSSSTSTAQSTSLNTTISFSNQNKNLVLAGPSSGSSAAAPSFRSLVADDIPDLSSIYLTSYTETDPVFSASAAAGITATDITNWDNKVSDDHKWNDVELNKSSSAGYSGYVPFLSTTNATTAKLREMSDSPNSGRIAVYNNNKYLISTTPSASDSSTKVATTAWVAGKGYLTSYTETDPTVPSWAKESSKPSYTASEVGAVATSAVGAASGVAPLNASSKIDSTYLPSYVDDIVEGYYYNSKFWEEAAHTTEITGEAGKIYVDLSTNKTYRYSGTGYVEVSSGSLVTITRNLTSGTKSATINVDGTDYDIYSTTPPVAATATPVVDGTAAVGSSSKYAKEDHVHPTDTSRAASTSVTTQATIDNTGLITYKNSGNTSLYTVQLPLFDGGSGASDLPFLPLAGGSLTGNLSIGGTTTSTGLLTASGGISTTTLTTSGNTTVGGNLSVSGATILGSTLGVTGATILNNTLNVTGMATVGGALDVDGSATFDSGVTIGGVLDVTQRRCKATLSDAGWYRVASCSLSGSFIEVSVGICGEQIVDADVLIVRSSTAQIVVKNAQSSNIISDMRVMLGGGSFHIDIQKGDNSSVTVSVDLTPHGNARIPGNLTAASLTAVADSPAGETELASISLARRTAPLSSPTSLITNGTIENSTTFSYTATQPCWFYYVPVLQAGVSGGFTVSLNSVTLASYISGEAIDVNVAAIPVPMQTGDVLDITQNSNRTSSYRVLTMRGAS